MSATLERLGTALADRYRIERELGAGGMATVYLAHDRKHDRRVAIKVLKPELAAVLGADRFVVEIKTTAALQHPHILPLFDSGEADGFLYYVMPFIDGETLRSKLDRETQLVVEEAVKIATEVADALQYAHEHGVIHRDIKPENILLANGRPMVADFGIALAVSAAAGGRMTETGLSLGTPHYMSPEQATAEREISARSDIYSLGAVLYEMLTGEPPHMGTSGQQIIMKIITEPAAPVTKLRKSVPPNVAAAVAKSLEKLPADRFENAKALANALRDPHFSVAEGEGGVSGARDSHWKMRFQVATTVAAALAVVVAIEMLRGSRAESTDPSMHLRLPLQPGDSIAVREPDVTYNGDRPSRISFVFTRDGKALIYAGTRNGKQQLFLRPLAGETATPIPGTEGGESPFLSPDGASLGFWSTDGLRRVSLDGGPSTAIAQVGRIAGASWGEDGRIVVGVLDVGLVVVSVTNAAHLDTIGPRRAAQPQWLPGEATVLFTSGADGMGHRIEALTLKTGVRKVLLESAADARYMPTGQLVFGRGGAMMAVPFDLRRLEITGSPVVVLDDVMQSLGVSNTDAVTGAMQAAISPFGQLAWMPGGIAPDRVSTVAWLDRQGRRTPVTSLGEDGYFMARLSPDEKRFALSVLGRRARILISDLKRQSTNTLPRTRGSPFLMWARDGAHVVFSGTVRDSTALEWVLADGSKPAEPFADTVRVNGSPAFWSSDGRELFTTARDRALRGYAVPGGQTRVVAGLPADATWPTLSSDGKWLAYGSMEAGSTIPDVFVQPWPALDRKWKVSSGGGIAPAWTRGGRELLYLKAAREDSMKGVMRMMSADVSPGTEFKASSPRELFRADISVPTPLRSWDVTADGSRFLIVFSRIPRAPAGEIHVATNWFATLRRLTNPGAHQ